MFREPYCIFVLWGFKYSFGKSCCKDSFYTVYIIEKRDGTERTERNTLDFEADPLRKTRETYWMHELRTIFPYGRHDRIGDVFETDNKHINVAANFSYLPRKYSRTNRGKSHKGVCCLLPQQFVKDLNQMLNISIKDAPNFIRISISSMKKFSLKTTHQLLSAKLSSIPPDLIFPMYYHQTIDLIESKKYKPLIS